MGQKNGAISKKILPSSVYIYIKPITTIKI